MNAVDVESFHSELGSKYFDEQQVLMIENYICLSFYCAFVYTWYANLTFEALETVFINNRFLPFLLLTMNTWNFINITIPILSENFHFLLNVLKNITSLIVQGDVKFLLV